MNRKQLMSLVTGLVLCFWFGVAFAEPVMWSGNGHYYDVVEDTTNMSWKEARDWAAGLTWSDASGKTYKGYLATITSSQEDSFIASLHFTKENYLLGGYQVPTTNEANSAERKADWYWVTGEKWEYTDWRSGEPNNFFRWVGVVGAGRSEEYLQYFPKSTSGSWNDVYTGTFTDDTGEHFFGIKNFIVEYEAVASSLIVTVDGVDVNLDWSAMPQALFYVLAVALSDEGGNVDMATLSFIDMGDQKTVSTSSLSSGLLFCATVLAYNSQGMEVSNTVEFMPFSGTVSLPGEIDGMLFRVDDPGGVGQIMLFGRIAGSVVTVNKISGDDGTGAFVLLFADNKPVSYTEGGITMFFSSLAEGVVEGESLGADFAQQSSGDCRESITAEIEKLGKDFHAEDRNLEKMIHVLASLSIMRNTYYGSDQVVEKCKFLMSLFVEARVELLDKFTKDRVNLQKQYDECDDDPDPQPNPYKIDNSCSIPDGAERWVRNVNGNRTEGWSISGVGYVGPLLSWVTEADEKEFLFSESCYAFGEKNGWDIFYYTEGKMSSARHYENGKLNGHWFDFFKKGTVKSDYTYIDGVNVSKIIYNEDGSIKSSWKR